MEADAEEDPARAENGAAAAAGGWRSTWTGRTACPRTSGPTPGRWCWWRGASGSPRCTPACASCTRWRGRGGSARAPRGCTWCGRRGGRACSGALRPRWGRCCWRAWAGASRSPSTTRSGARRRLAARGAGPWRRKKGPKRPPRRKLPLQRAARPRGAARALPPTGPSCPLGAARRRPCWPVAARRKRRAPPSAAGPPAAAAEAERGQAAGRRRRRPARRRWRRGWRWAARTSGKSWRGWWGARVSWMRRQRQRWAAAAGAWFSRVGRRGWWGRQGRWRGSWVWSFTVSPSFSKLRCEEEENIDNSVSSQMAHYIQPPPPQ
mmetsp:Transcript_43617/g.71243  ORF Transcript_43617/g.71243 Transcript_43617/m.71243 type:complete len:321 (-) Transcript_43617:270-1232(-)